MAAFAHAYTSEAGRVVGIVTVTAALPSKVLVDAELLPPSFFTVRACATLPAVPEVAA